MKITNHHDISVPLAIWLLHDEYDYINQPNYISATTLLKPTKQFILAKRVPREQQEVDLSDLIASSIGSALHDSIEKAWRVSAASGMAKLGYPEHIAAKLRVNPSPEELLADPDIIPVWFEKRSFREVLVNGVTWTVGGKFDTVLDGRLFDNKSTSVWTYIKGRKDEDHGQQGSIYRWLNPELITSDHIFIQYIFTDWSRAMVNQIDGYPEIRIKENPVPLLSIEDTDKLVRAKILDIQRSIDLPEEQMPPCSDKDLWRGDPQYKYYSDPDKANIPGSRSSKNFDNLAEASAHMAAKGGKGVVKTIPGDVKACEYCPAFPICKQRENYFVGSL